MCVLGTKNPLRRLQVAKYPISALSLLLSNVQSDKKAFNYSTLLSRYFPYFEQNRYKLQFLDL